MKLKRIAAMLTAAVMAVSLAACGGNADTNTAVSYTHLTLPTNSRV